MQNPYSVFEIPSFARAEAYDFAAEKADFDAYQELNKIAEEIEKCRNANS